MIDTIFSLSSGAGRAGVAVIRISGPLSDYALEQLCGRLPAYRVASLMTIFEPETRTHLDQGLVLRFAKGKSFTGELSCELQVHGSRAVVQVILRVLSRLNGFRAAKAGEFTRRAMENGCLDLTQVEALADLIDADTEEQRKQALNSLKGLLGREVRGWREILREIKGLIAAEIDFSDEGDVADNFNNQIDSLLQRLEVHFRSALASFEAGRIISDGFRVALIGPPNAGKSSLLNALSGSEVAIVTEHAGTTRDILEVRLDIDGYPVVLIDTAGMRDAVDPVEIIGVSRARFVASQANLILILDDTLGTDFMLPPELADIKSIRIRSKLDLQSSQVAVSSPQGFDLALSAQTGEGLVELRGLIAEQLREVTYYQTSVILSRYRHKEMVERALMACTHSRTSLAHGIEFVDDSVRSIDQALAELLGEIGVEEVLGEVFSRFCVGK